MYESVTYLNSFDKNIVWEYEYHITIHILAQGDPNKNLSIQMAKNFKINFSDPDFENSAIWNDKFVDARSKM